jgi:transposase
MRIAGVDVGKRRLDAAVHGGVEEIGVENTPKGWSELLAWLKAQGVGRVGLEASGGQERGVRGAAEAAGLEVVVHQPLEVRLYARLKRIRAKNDKLDAKVIAAATAQVEAVRAAQDPRLQALAEQLTAYEQTSELIAQVKTFLESHTAEDLIAAFKAHLRSLAAAKARLAARIIEMIRAHPDLAERYELLRSLPGFGPIVAASTVIRMPELGAMRHGQAASLIGVAPFDRDSGQHKGQRFISGGRARPRRLLYLAALAAKRCDPSFKTFADRLRANGKAPKVAIVAVMRKLIEAANLVLQRRQPWLKHANT